MQCINIKTIKQLFDYHTRFARCVSNKVSPLQIALHQSVCNWVKAFVERVKDSSMPVPKRKADESISEMDELFTFVTKKAKKSMSAHM